MSKGALGRGFDTLIPTGFDLNHVAEPGESIKQIPVVKIFTNPSQPRKKFDENALIELAESIKVHGVIQPLIVTPKGGEFRIVAGERRYRAAKIAGLKKVPVIVRNHHELEELEIALVENVQRVDLSPLEQAISIVRLRDQFSMTPKEIAKKLGKAETTISNIVRLLQLPKSAIAALSANTISEGHARAILAVKFSYELQEELLKNIIKNGLSVRECEEWVRQQKITNEQKFSSISAANKKLVESISIRGFSVKLHEKKHGGSLIFSFKNEKELKKILEQF